MIMWDYTGLVVSGLYLNEIPVSGKVELSRVAYGGGVKHHVVLDEPVNVYGVLRDRVILEMKQVLSVKSRG